MPSALKTRLILSSVRAASLCQWVAEQGGTRWGGALPPTPSKELKNDLCRFFYYTILSVLPIIILRWLGALAAPGKRLSRGGRRSVAAQLPLSRATGPTASPQVCPARRTDARGAVVFLVKLLAAGACAHCWQDVRRANSSAPEKSASLLPIWCTIFKPHRLKDFDSLWQQKNRA